METNLTLVEFAEQVLSLKLSNMEKRWLAAIENKESSIITEKKCSTCKEVFPATIEFFYPNKCSSDGLQYQCKKCQSEYSKKYYHNVYKTTDDRRIKQ